MIDEHDDDENFSADIEERINRAAEDRAHDLHTDSGPRSGGCLLILALPVLSLLFW
jgi:hypothetical protein